MPGLIEIWGMVPDALRPFLFPSVVSLWIWWVTHNKKTEEDREAEKWESANLKALRDENDRQGRRIAELEDRMAELRRIYEATIDKMRRGFEADTQRMAGEINRGWDLARDWCGVAHELRHRIANLMFLIPESKRPPMPDPLPGIDRRPGLPAEKFPARYGGTADERG